MAEQDERSQKEQDQTDKGTPDNLVGDESPSRLAVLVPWIKSFLFSWTAVLTVAFVALGVLLIGLSLFAIACSGYFGKICKQDIAADDPTVKTLSEIIEKSEKTLGVVQNPSRVEATDPAGEKRLYCQLIVPDEKDRQFLSGGYVIKKTTLGITREQRLLPDQNLIASIEYLCRRHARLAISHAISAYINMEIDPESASNRDPQIVRNVSAHKDGQAVDLVEVDYVYKVFRPGICTPKPPFLFDVYYYNDREELLLYFPCKERPENTNWTFQGAPAQAIPIRIAWQDQIGTFALGGLPLDINTALKTLVAQLGLPPEAITLIGGAFEGTLQQIGQNYLTQLLRLPEGSLNGLTLEGILQSVFDGKLADLAKFLPRDRWGVILEDIVRSGGAAFLEDKLGLFPGSLQGWGTPNALFRSLGLETVANILRVPTEALLDPAKAVKFLAQLSSEDLQKLSNDPLGRGLLPIIDALKGGNTFAAQKAVEVYGQRILEQVLGVPEGSLSPCIETDRRSCPDPLASLSLVSERTGIPLDTLRQFVTLLTQERAGLFDLNSEAVAKAAENLGISPEAATRFLTFTEQGGSVAGMERILGLPAGSLTSLLSGNPYTFDAKALAEISTRLGISSQEAQRILNSLQTVRGIGTLEGLLGVPSGSLSLLFSGGSFGSLLEQNGLPIIEGALGLPSGSLRDILSGGRFDFDAATIQRVAIRLGADAQIVREFLGKIGQGQNLLSSIQQMGSVLLSQSFTLSDPLSLFQIATGVAPESLVREVEAELRSFMKDLNLPADSATLEKLLSGNPDDLLSLFQNFGGTRIGDIFGLSLQDVRKLASGDLTVLTKLPAFQDLTDSILDSLGINLNQITDFLNGNALLSSLSQIGNQLNGAISLLGIDQFLVVERVYKPEARFKTHLSVKELLEMPFTLENIDLRVTQLIVHSKERDVIPFAQDGTLDKVYGKDRPANYGLFAMPEAWDHIHIGY